MTIKLKLNEYVGRMHHPGEVLRDELKARHILQRELAARMGRSHTVISDIINGRKSITPETALELEDALGDISAQTWLNLQLLYELDRARMAREAAKAS